MNGDKMHISELVGHRVRALYKLPLVIPAEFEKFATFCARGFVEFEDGLVVELEGRMEVPCLARAGLPAGCESLFVTSGEHGPEWDVVDVGCDAWYSSFCLLLRANRVLGVKLNDQGTLLTFEPESGVFDPLEAPAWLHGPLPQLHDEYAVHWWEGPCGARATLAEIEAAPPPAAGSKPEAPRPGFFHRLFGG